MKKGIEHLSKDEMITYYEMHSNPTGAESSTGNVLSYLFIGIIIQV